jgi:hypothetical protein
MLGGGSGEGEKFRLLFRLLFRLRFVTESTFLRFAAFVLVGGAVADG